MESGSLDASPVSPGTGYETLAKHLTCSEIPGILGRAGRLLSDTGMNSTEHSSQHTQALGDHS